MIKKQKTKQEKISLSGGEAIKQPMNERRDGKKKRRWTGRKEEYE